MLDHGIERFREQPLGYCTSCMTFFPLPPDPGEGYRARCPHCESLETRRVSLEEMMARLKNNPLRVYRFVSGVPGTWVKEVV